MAKFTKKIGNGGRNSCPKKIPQKWANKFIFVKIFFFLNSKELTFSALVKDNQALILKVSRLYADSAEDQDDLFQEIVLQLWRSYDTFKGDSKITTWMYKVALNTAVSIFRKKKKNLDTDELQDYHFAGFDDEDGDKHEQISLLYRVIKMLPEMERAIAMMYLDDLPYREIATTLGITEVNARVKMNRLKKTLKDLMEKHG